MMRSVCFVDRLEFEFSGNHYSNAIAIGDVDNDKLNELLVGNVDGVLAIFKGDKLNKPWKKCSELGTVTCVGVGDIFNCGSNAVVVINAERRCHLFMISSNSDAKSPQPPAYIKASTSSSGGGSTSSDQHGAGTPANRSKTMKPLFTLTLEFANVKALSVSKLDGKYDLYVGSTDRCVGVYRWNEDTKKLDMRRKFSLPGQIGCLSEGLLKDRTPQILISQPGGTYVPVTCQEKSSTEVQENTQKTKSGLDFELGNVIGQAQRRSPTSSTEVVGSIRANPCAEADADKMSCSDVVALCTLDGVVRLLKDRKKQWELQVDHGLFAIGKLDVTGDGCDEIVVCAWDGTTYIVDHSRNCVRFHFDQNVSGFCCGYYGLSDGVNQPCLVYTTFSNMIHLYHNVTLPSIPPSNLLLTMQNKSTVPSTMQDQLLLMDSKEKQELFSQCLYSYKVESQSPSTAHRFRNY